MEQLGIEPIQLLTQVVNFVLMVFLLTKFLYKPILDALDKRRKKIEEGLAFSEKMKAETEEMSKKHQEMIDEAKEEARRIIDEGKKNGKALEQEIIDKAHSESAQIVEKGREELEVERSQMERQLRVQTVQVAKSMTEKILADSLKESDHRRIIDQKIEEISKLIK